MTLEAINENEWVDGPTVFAVAWIPKRRYYRQIPNGLWNHRLWYSWLGMMTLTGNDPPPDEFRGQKDFERFVHSKAYRAIVGFRNVRIRPPLEGETQVRYESKKIRVGGYTPLMRQRFHSRGEFAGIESTTNAVEFSFVNLQNNLEFRVGKLMNFLHKMATCHWLTHASVTVHYSLDYYGEHQIEVSSTVIPNLTLYVDWRKVRTYSIDGVVSEQVEDFVTAYTKKIPATEEVRFEIKCRPGQEPVIDPPE